MPENPRVLIVLGSTSDEEVAKKAEDVLTEFGIEYEVAILSAHRNPEGTARIARLAVGHGVKVIIAGAGLAAALPGVLAAHTTLP
ncbi:MAG: AIR carboxylase family protein, partial [Patescibacteria group bacterium]|nr:AIR carboxylase family protein [Patescibacteria group bacterium]